MPSATGWFGWTLALAGALGGVLPARGGPAPAPESTNVDAIKVKIAWLADRDTFACILGAHSTSAGVEVCGRIPNEKVHKRALALAQANSSSRIVDRLEVSTQMIKRQPRETSSDLLQRNAVALLHKAFGERARKYRVSASANGVVMVAGTVGSFEEKLQVSQELRLLNPCACVLNQLIVTTIERNGLPYQPVLAQERIVPVPAVATEPTAKEPSAVLPSSPAGNPVSPLVTTALEPKLPPMPETVPAQQLAVAGPPIQVPPSYPLPPPVLPEQQPTSPVDRNANATWSGSITTATFSSGPIVAPSGLAQKTSANPGSLRSDNGPVPPPEMPAVTLPLLPVAGTPANALPERARIEQQAVRTLAFTSGPGAPPTDSLVPAALPSSVTLPAVPIPEPAPTKASSASEASTHEAPQQDNTVSSAPSRRSFTADLADIDGWSVWAVGVALGSIVIALLVPASVRRLRRAFATDPTVMTRSTVMARSPDHATARWSGQETAPQQRSGQETAPQQKETAPQQKKEEITKKNTKGDAVAKRPANPPQQDLAEERASAARDNTEKKDPKEPEARQPTKGAKASSLPPCGLIQTTSAPRSAPCGTSVATQPDTEPAVSVRWLGPQTARLGQPVSCQICARNTSSRPVRQVVVRHELPLGITFQGTTPEAIHEGTWLSWPLGTLQPGQEQRIVLHLLPDTKGDLNCEAHVSFTDSCTLRLRIREPRLTLQVSAPDEVVLGQTATLVLVVTNPGDGVAETVKIAATLPEGLEHAGSRRIAMELGSLGPQESRTVQLLCGTRAGGRQACEVVATADGATPAQDRVVLEVLLPELALAVTGPKLRYIDRHARYVIRVTNPGSAPASNVTITHQIPDGFQFHTASAGGRHDEATRAVCWFVGDLLPGQDGEMTVDLTAVAAGTCTQLITAQAVGGLKARSEVVTRVEGLSALQMEIVNLDEPVEVGSDTAYEIRVSNAGSRTETGVELTCTIPEGMEFRGATSAAGAGFLVEGSEIVFEPLPGLAPRALTIYRVQVVGQSAGDLRFHARLHAKDLSAPVMREKSIRVYSDELAVR